MNEGGNGALFRCHDTKTPYVLTLVKIAGQIGWLQPRVPLLICVYLLSNEGFFACG